MILESSPALYYTHTQTHKHTHTHSYTYLQSKHAIGCSNTSEVNLECLQVSNSERGLVQASTRFQARDDDLWLGKVVDALHLVDTLAQLPAVQSWSSKDATNENSGVKIREIEKFKFKLKN